MESSPVFLPYAGPAQGSIAGAVEEEKGKENEISSQVDQFLVEAIENPRHRLTVLRMELDIQKFMQNPDQHQFEFQHFPTSYLRCAAHRVAQHYGLQTSALDYTVDGPGSKIVARKTPESKFPAICLSDIPLKQPETNKPHKVKIAILPRQDKPSMADSVHLGMKRNTMRTVEEREEEYDKARARIFNGSSKPVIGPSSISATVDKSNICPSSDGQESYKTSIDTSEKNSAKDGASRVAIFRDREKDMTDPDYDRSYTRYNKGITPSHSFNLAPCNVLQPSPVQFQESISHLGQLPATQPLVSYRLSDPPMSPYVPVGRNQTPVDTVYMQWPNPAVMYAQSYVRRPSLQAPVYQQPLSFERWQSY
ncbi:uncharacterized protein A4U43_C02F16200 [Asparagus officinalis]|uniref:SUZ domain-containing protein n=1 Tax=Asparagus officinalis TaxID=4686 RepID=A0A5P1FIV3_ASPOF|nr:cAMP-regulated phosphoprotein 21-like isoform X2 [Asparagus officinalis]ONK78248.1 uncharacterized protein A4U43_C02F16200 [Asparagus officinalis]